MGESLNPTLLSRFSRALRPDFTRTLLARRVAAGGLVVLAGVAALAVVDAAHQRPVGALPDEGLRRDFLLAFGAGGQIQGL